MAQEPPVPPVPPVQPVVPAPGDITDNDKLMAALAYFTTFFFPLIVPLIIFLVDTMRVRPYQRYHALQSLGLTVAEVVYIVLACIVFTACTALSVGLLSCVLWVLFLVPVIPAIYYAYLAYARPSYFEIPVITPFMKQQGWLKV